MYRRFRTVTLAVALIAAPLGALLAQRDSVTRTEAETPGRWAVALGVNALQFNPKTDRPGTRVELFGSIARHTPLTRGLDLRTQLFAGVAPGRGLTLSDPNECGDCALWTSRQTAGLDATLNYELRTGKAVRPYVLSGAGVVFMRDAQKIEGNCAPGMCMDIGPAIAEDPTRWVGMSYSLGVGVTVRAFGRTMFGEYGRHTAPLVREMKPIAPFRIGLRF